MKKIIILICMTFLYIQVYSQDQRIFGGTQIDIGEAPYQVSLEINGDHGCGGTIVDCEWIVTAGHCVDGNTVPADIVVHAGSTDQTDNNVGQRIDVAQIIIHDDYTPFAPGNVVATNDIALLRLVEPLEFNENVRAIDYATPANTTLDDIAPGVVGFISGWGDSGNNCCEDDLLAASLPIISNADANDLIDVAANNCQPAGNDPVDDSMIAFWQDGIAAGPGDSGGPAVIGSGANAVLIGVSSWGGCDRDDFPTIYANVRALSEFLDDNVVFNDCCAEDLAYHFEDKHGNERNEFCLGADVFVDGSQTIETSNFFMDLWIVDANGDLDWISGAGWIPGSPDLVNITQLFENDPEHPVNFESGVTYALKLAINHPFCGWTELIHTFTFYEPDSVVYHYEDENGIPKDEFCLGEDVYVNGSETLGTNNYFMDLWVVDNNGDYDWISGAGWISGSPDLVNITELFANDPEHPVNFEPNKKYSVKLAINDPDCGWVELQHDFTYICCDDFWDASFFPNISTSGGAGTYTIQSANFELYENHNVLHEWYLLEDDGNGGYIPITSSIGNFNYSSAEPGVEYTLVHKLRTPCGEICYARTIRIGRNSQNTEITSTRDTFDCDIIDQLFPCEPKIGKLFFNCENGNVGWLGTPGADGYVIRIFYNQGECCDTPLTEPDKTVYLNYTENSYAIPEADEMECLTIQLGVRCENDITWGDPKCKTCCRIEESPKNLSFDCDTNWASFDPVAGADEYVVEVIYNDEDCFCFEEREEMVRWEIGTNTRFRILPRDRYHCFSFRVGAKCEGLSTIIWSNKECVWCFDEFPRVIKDIPITVKIIPNPASSKVEFQVNTKDKDDGIYTIYTMAGNIVTRFRGNSYSTILNVDSYPSGIYFVKFETNNYSSNVQKLIIKH